MSYVQHRIGGTSPATLHAQVCDPIVDTATGTIIITTQFGRAMMPRTINASCTQIGVGGATLDVQVAAVSILTAPIAIAAVNVVYAGTFAANSILPNGTAVSFIFTNNSGDATAMQNAKADLTGEVAHTA